MYLQNIAYYVYTCILHEYNIQTNDLGMNTGFETFCPKTRCSSKQIAKAGVLCYGYPHNLRFCEICS